MPLTATLANFVQFSLKLLDLLYTNLISPDSLRPNSLICKHIQLLAEQKLQYQVLIPPSIDHSFFIILDAIHK